MSLSNYAETKTLEALFKGVAIPWSNLYLALHTADPAEAGTATTSEATYSGYARIALDSVADITVSGNQITNTNLEQFAICSGGTNTVTHASIVDSASGAGNIIVYAPLNNPIAVSVGVQPQFPANGIVWTIN